MKFPLSVLLLLVCAACSSTPDSSYYTLSADTSPQSTGVTQAGEQIWMLDAVTIPEILNRPQMILKSGPNGIVLLEYDRWAEPLDSSIRRILSYDLMLRSGGAPAVAGQPTKHITVAIDEFDSDETGHVYLTATWQVKCSDVTASYRYRIDEMAGSREISAIVATMNRMLSRFADNLVIQLTAPSALPSLPAAAGSR